MGEFLIQLHERDGEEGQIFLAVADDFDLAAAEAWEQAKAWEKLLGISRLPETIPEWANPVALPMVVTDAMLATIVNEMESDDITVTTEQAREMIAGHADLRRVMLSHYAEHICHGMDTSDADHLHDAFAQVILGAERWPMYRDSGSEVASDFCEKVLQKADAGVITLTQEMRETFESKSF